MGKRFFLIVVTLFLVSCSQSGHQAEAPVEPGTNLQGSVPAEFSQGEALFLKNCAVCHGEKARGTDKGPSFLSSIYHPDHHGDESFILAARNGVRAHHWQFGDMPPVPNVREEQVKEIIGYVRWLQREAKVY